MGNEIRASLSRPDQSKGKHWKLPGFRMKRQLEAVRKQRLHHQPQLVFGGVGNFRSCMNFEVFRDSPLGREAFFWIAYGK